MALGYINYLDNYGKVSDIAVRRKFASDLFEAFKIKNMNEGVQWYQAMHLHDFLKNYKVILPPQLGSVEMHVDLVNILIAGDIETGCLALTYGEQDDMSLPYHWFSEERRLWLIEQMKRYLGWIP
jgi:hypothetical protein